jgi:hypothetical protein
MNGSASCRGVAGGYAFGGRAVDVASAGFAVKVSPERITCDRRYRNSVTRRSTCCCVSASYLSALALSL